MGAAPKLSSKRAHERHPVAIKAKVRAIGSKAWIEGDVINLSRGGSCLQCAEGFFIGQMVEIMILKQGGIESHKLTATVVWKRENKHGLNFL